MAVALAPLSGVVHLVLGVGGVSPVEAVDKVAQATLVVPLVYLYRRE